MDFRALSKNSEKVFQLSSKERVNGQAAVISGGSGAFSRAISTNAEYIAHKPKSLSYTEAAALPIGAMRAMSYSSHTG
jgi:NADPH:quinone reductase-like Zn-dependent oxidoreductase